MLGEVIHGYRIDRLLSAEGGFGDVYLATHVESGAEAVVKVLKPEMSALRDIVARFFNEARAAASIHHPGIVQIHNVGYHGDRAYLLMERLRGADLETRLRSGPLPLDRAIVFLRQTAGAIGAAHERGIVHRDLKPANLFIVEDPDVIGGERVKVLDFGIAKLTADTGAGKTQGVFGTPAYMSPEQCASAGAVDARSDLYSLGCIFYELGCGRPPFGHGGIELIAAHLRDTPAAPRAVAPWLPVAIERVILQLLEKQPDRRLPSCAALIAALDEAAQSSGLPPGSTPRVPSHGVAASAHSLTTLGSAAAAVSTMPGGKRGLGLWIALGMVVVVGGVFATVMAMSRSTSIGGGSPPVAPGDASVAIAEPKDAAIAVVTQDAASPPATEDAAQPGARLRAEPGEAVDTRRTTVATAQAEPRGGTAKSGSAASAPDPVAPSGTVAEQAGRLNEAGKAEMYADRYDKALSLFRRAYELEPRALLLFNIAVAEYQLGRCQDARRSLQRVMATWPGEQPAKKAKTMLDRIGTCQ